MVGLNIRNFNLFSISQTKLNKNTNNNLDELKKPEMSIMDLDIDLHIQSRGLNSQSDLGQGLDLMDLNLNDPLIENKISTSNNDTVSTNLIDLIDINLPTEIKKNNEFDLEILMNDVNKQKTDPGELSFI